MPDGERAGMYNVFVCVLGAILTSARAGVGGNVFFASSDIFLRNEEEEEEVGEMSGGGRKCLFQ